jgi:hypothetical protein
MRVDVDAPTTIRVRTAARRDRCGSVSTPDHDPHHHPARRD